jgi:anion-transporting  ArsA/GET3 family ATPase
VLAGALEYAAVEMLYDVYASGRYDLIVLDTPPSQNAIDFLEAPSKMINFIEQSSNQWFLKPSAMAGKIGLKLLDVGASIISKTLGKMAGGETIKELSQFLVAFSDLYDGFQKRYDSVRGLMGSDEVGFVLVTSTQANQRAAMRRFQNDLAAGGFKTRGVVVNRIRQVHYEIDAVKSALTKLKTPLSPEEEEEIHLALEQEAYLAEQDQRGLQELERELTKIPVVRLPELRLDAHDLESLSMLHQSFLTPDRSSS